LECFFKCIRGIFYSSVKSGKQFHASDDISTVCYVAATLHCVSNAVKTLFWLSLTLLAYAYVGYPLLLVAICALGGGRETKRDDVTPTITMIVPVYNGAEIIADKLEHLFALEYPKERMEIVVVSDGSNDGTADIVRRYVERDPRVRLVEVATQRGKEHAINEGVAVANGEVVVVSDSGVHPRTDALLRLLRPFADPAIGAATGVDISEDAGRSAITGVAGLYTRYEIAIRKLEMEVGTVVVVNGCFFAVRKPLVPRLVPHVTADLFVPFNVIRNGYRVALELDAGAVVRTSRSVEAEFRRRVRTFNRGITTFFTGIDLLNVLRYGWVPVQLVSHKFARWLVPAALLGILISTASLSPSSAAFSALFVAQGAGYTMAILGLTGVMGQRYERLISVASFYLLSNLAIVVAWTQVIRGHKAGTWKPTER
jgi:cellulose synthase/poly-beta-1,6-N-acetylglucosamine synthase-like glycosyltransferase